MRLRIAVFIATLLLPMVVLAYWLAEVRQAQELEHLRQNALTVARAVASQQARTLEQVQEHLQRVAIKAGKPDAAAFARDCPQQLPGLVGVRPLYLNVGFVDHAGNVSCATKPPAWTLHVGDREYYREVIEHRRFAVSKVLQTRDNGAWTMIAAHPVLGSQNDLRGVLIASLDLSWAQRALDGLRLPPQSIVSLVDAEGTVIARSPENRYAGEKIPGAAGFVKALATKKIEGFEETPGLDGVARLIAYTPVPGSQAYVRVGMPKATVETVGQRALQASLVAIAAVLALTLLLGWAGARSLVLAPIRRLISAAEKLGAGDYSARTGLPHDPNAIGKLARKFDELAAQSQRANRALLTLSAGNRTLLRETDEQALIEAMCRVAVDKGGYPLALVSYAMQDEARSVITRAHAGASNGFVELGRLSWGDNERGQGTVGTAIRSGGHCVMHSTSDDPRFRPWREAAIRHGFGSIVSLPLHVAGEVIGTFTLLAAEADAFDASELALLDEIAADLSFGILVIRSEAKRLEAERAAARANRALKTLSAGNRTLLRERDEQSLLEAMCRVAVEKGGYRLAMVNYRMDDAERSVLTRASYGADNGFIAELKLTWADTERGRGTVGPAIRTGRTVALSSTADDPNFLPWREAALRNGFGSVVSLPLRVADEVIGTLTLIAADEDAFDTEELALLDEMAADLSFGIAVIRSEQKRIEAERIAERALTHDDLTGLPNRHSIILQLGREIQAKRIDANETEAPDTRDEPVAVLVLHLARFQEIYDGFGYAPGNDVIRAIAQRLRKLPGMESRLARLTGEDFALLLPGEDARAAEHVARELYAALEEPVHIGAAQIHISAVVGASFHPGHGDDPDTLLRRASIAAREAARKDLRYLAYRGISARENPERLALAAELRGAIARAELALHFQPKVDISTGRMTGCEALIRWPHAARGMIPPAQFVPIAEETGMIRSMTYLVLELAMRQQHAWAASGRSLPIAVNLSVRNLHDPRLIDTFEGLLNTWGVEPRLIEIEITESALAEDPETAQHVLSRLGKMGFKIYIDDFGTGYSSLNYLVTLPVHALKIDRSFVQKMTSSRQAHSVVASIISMAHNLGLKVVAEGVETAEELGVLKELGCDKAQGYLLGRPVPASNFDRLSF